MRSLAYRPAAIASLDAIQDYIAEDNPRRAVTFVEELRAQCRKLASLPGAHGRARPELHPGLRSYAFKGYVILFCYIGNVFEVVQVTEGHRDIENMTLE